jgi:hypothetical protein
MNRWPSVPLNPKIGRPRIARHGLPLYADIAVRRCSSLRLSNARADHSRAAGIAAP